MSSTDAVFSPQGVKKNYQTHLSASHRTTFLSSVRGKTGAASTAITASPVWSRKPVTFTETPKISTTPACKDTTQSATWKTPYPKILQDGAVENFRPQEVHEKVTAAEPLSPPNEQEALAETTSEDKEGEEDWSNVGVEPPEERPVVEPLVSPQVESGLSTEPPFRDEVIQHQFTTPNLTPYHVRMKEESCGFSDESDKEMPFEIPAEKEDMQEPHAPIDAWVEKEGKSKEVEHVQEDTSDSGTEAVIEPNFESRTSSPVSEYEPEESMFNKVTDLSRDENVVKEDAVELRQETSCSIVGTYEADVEDKLYPDGEEMDTWDSVMEKKVDLKTYDSTKKDEEKRQHAEPEEDISTREREHEKREIRQDFATDVPRDDSSSMIDTQVDDEGPRAALELPGNEEDDEEEDSQNVSVSWRTELEGESYAQENTLADTRPLIRYKSDETDANTQASHMDESESSEGEQEKKVGETEMWGEGKSKRFGTMEDLCEEVEGEALDEEYDLGYTYIEDRGVGHGKTEYAMQANDKETAEEMIGEVSEGHSDEETEELTKPTVPTKVDGDEELETDRLVEQELENLDTDSYSAHFGQKQVSESEEMLDLKHKSIEEMAEEEEDTFPCVEPEVRVNQELTPSTAIIDQPYDNLYFSDSSVTDPEVQPKDQKAPEKREEEDEHNVSMVTHADETENPSGFIDFISRPDIQEINSSEEPNSVLELTTDQGNLEDVAVPTEVKDAVPVEPSSVSQEHLTEDVADCQEVPETAEWEVLENPSEDFEIRDQNEDYEECDHVPESAESPLHDDGGIMTQKEQPLKISPDRVHDDIFVVKNSTEVLKTNGKDSNLHAFFSSSVKNDYWVSSLETGATYQPDDNEAAEQTNQNLGFADNLVWGDLENPNVVNWNSRLDIDSSKALAAKKEQEQMHSEVKQVLCRNVVEGELVHSEESEVEAESWSSGEEPV